MGKNDIKETTSEVPIERFDLNMVSGLRGAVHNKIRDRFYNRRYDKVMRFVVDDFLQEIEKMGGETFKDKELTDPYQGYRWEIKDLTLLRFKNFDCCLNICSNYTSLEFERVSGYYDINVTNSTTQEVVDWLLQLDKDMPSIIKACKKSILQAEKKAKMKALNKSTVASVVKATLKGTGIKYKLDLRDTQAYLTVKLDHGLETKFALSYKDFMKKIVYVVSTVEQLNSIMQNLGQPLRIKSTYFRVNKEDDWEESK